MRRLAVVLATLAALVPAAPAFAAAGPVTVTYRPPVDAPVVDAFRAPAQNWNAGNRGLEYATVPGTPVTAAAPGQVVFAGPVAGGLHVVVLHDDGIRTSYSFLRTITVHRGDAVTQGQPVGTAGDRFHFGARAGDAYLDPARLLGDGPPEVHLVPEELRRAGSESAERAGLSRLVRAVGSWVADNGAQAADWARGQLVAGLDDHLDEVRGAIHYGVEGLPATHVVRFGLAAQAWRRARDTCTPAGVAAPRLQERHLAVLVGDLGSTSSSAAVDGVDTAALGYARPDVVRYSYNGGTTADHPYSVVDTTVDLHQSARRLRELLQRLQAEHPGVPIDIVAHGQGGVVARTALTDEVDGADPRLASVASLVTLGSPHRGMPVATGLAMAAHTTSGELVESAAHAVLPGTIDPAAPAVTQLAEESEFLRRLNRRPLPAGLKATSIGAREDLLAPAGLTQLDGADNVIVSVPGHLSDHSDLPGSAQAQREIALGLAGRAPTCQSLGDALTDAAVSDAVRGVEAQIGGAAWIGGKWADRKVDELRDPDFRFPEKRRS